MKKFLLSLLFLGCFAYGDTPPIIYQFNSPLVKTGGRIVSIPAATSSVNGYLTSSDWSLFNSKQASGNYLTALTGDGTASGPGSGAFTLSTVNSNVGSFGSATQTGTFTVNAKGLVTAASSTSIQIAESQVTNLVSDLAGKQATGNYITALTGDVTATGPGSVAATIANNAVTNAKSAQMATLTLKGNSTGSTADPQDLTGTQATTILNNFVGDSGAGTGVKGLVPAPGTSQGSTGKYLDAAGSFTDPGLRVSAAAGVTAVSTWTSRSATAANQWFGAAWAPELQLFCAVSSSGTNRVMWSRDGVSWTSASATSAQVWTKMAWSPQLRLFAAVAFDGTTSTNLMTSPDCRTWTARTSTEANQWYDIVWNPTLGKFLAVSINGTNRCMSSTDGITWSTCSMAAAIQWYSVTWSPELNLYAAVSITASGSNYAATSPDGVTWTMRALTTGNTWYSVTWAKEIGLFVAVGATGTNRAATSPDGITWTLRGIQSAAWRRVKWSPELRQLVAVASGGQISTSPDGITWTARTSPEANQWYELVYSPELMRFVMFGITGTNRVQTSKDIGYIQGNKLASDATPLATSEAIIRRDQNGSFAATNALLGSAAATGTNTVLTLDNGHIKTTQTTAPTAVVDANAGTAATCVLSNANDIAGKIVLTAGNAATVLGSQCAITFNKAYGVAPVCTLTPTNANAALVVGGYPTTTTTVLTLNFTAAATVLLPYNFNYSCVETQ